jgi:hypothetical protein
MSIQQNTRTPAGENGSAISQGNIGIDTATGSARRKRRNKRRNGRRGRRGFAGKIKDGQMKGIIIEDGPDMAAQYEYFCKNLCYYCYQNTMVDVPYVIENVQELPDAYFRKVRKKPDESQWTVKYQENVGTNADKKVVTKTLVFDESLRDRLMHEYELELKLEREEETNHEQNKRSVADLIINQLCRTTINRMRALSKGNRDAEALETGDLLAVIRLLRTVCGVEDENGKTQMSPYELSSS